MSGPRLGGHCPIIGDRGYQWCCEERGKKFGSVLWYLARDRVPGTTVVLHEVRIRQVPHVVCVWALLLARRRGGRSGAHDARGRGTKVLDAGAPVLTRARLVQLPRDARPVPLHATAARNEKSELLSQGNVDPIGKNVI